MTDIILNLPDDPAMPESREPAAVVPPTRRQLMMLASDMGMASIDEAVMKFALAALALWGYPAAPHPAPEIPEEIRLAFAELERKEQSLRDFRSLRGSLAADRTCRPATPPAPAVGEGPSIYWGNRPGILDSSITPPPEAVEPTEEALEQAYESAYQPAWEQGDSHDAHLKGLRAVFALAAPPALPPNYIDPEHQGDDRELLQTFYRACRADGGTADEIHLRGIRAVLAARSATPPAPAEGEVGEVPEPTHEQISQWINANDVLRPGSTGGPMIRVGTNWRAAFADAARWGAQFRPAAPPAPAVVPVAVSERLPGPEDCAPWLKEPNASAWCWMGKEMDGGWEWEQRSAGYLVAFPGDFTHWLPAHALPLPSGEVEG